jgi:cytochrome c oxidase subunit 2
VGVTVFELFLLAYVSTPLWRKITQIPQDDPTAIHLRVVAQQFQWIFHYPGKDGKYGRTRLDLVDDSNFLGLDRSDLSAKDDVVSLNHLHIPVKRKIVAELSAKDVIHSFFIPVLRVKTDVIPGMRVRTWFEATSPGQGFEIGCAQLCGVGHNTMRGFLHIDSETEFEKWLEDQTQQIRLSAVP